MIADLNNVILRPRDYPICHFMHLHSHFTGLGDGRVFSYLADSALVYYTGWP